LINHRYFIRIHISSTLLVYPKNLDLNIFVRWMGFITISSIESELSNFPCLKNCIHWIKTVSMHLTRTLKSKTLRLRKALLKVATQIKKTHLMEKSLEKKITSYLNFLIYKSSNPTLSFFKVCVSIIISGRMASVIEGGSSLVTSGS
jgi:hypothetical protein